MLLVFFFFFKQKTAYEISACLVGSEMCIRDRAKGVGELGLCGVSAAIANAVYNATGIRVRDYPITLDKLLDKLPDVV